MSDLVRIEYKSEMTISLIDLGLLDIIRDCDRRHAERIVSGFLHYDGKGIHELIEGPRNVVEPVFTKICGNYRRHGKKLLDRSSIASRSTEGFELRFIPRKQPENKAPLSSQTFSL